MRSSRLLRRLLRIVCLSAAIGVGGESRAGSLMVSVGTDPAPNRDLYFFMTMETANGATGFNVLIPQGKKGGEYIITELAAGTYSVMPSSHHQIVTNCDFSDCSKNFYRLSSRLEGDDKWTKAFGKGECQGVPVGNIGTASCGFAVRANRTIAINVIAQGGDSLFPFLIKDTGNNPTSELAFAVASAGGKSSSFFSVAPMRMGDYLIVATSPPGWTLTGNTCRVVGGNANEGKFDTGDECTFTYMK